MDDGAGAERVPLTREQRGLWFLAQLGEDVSAAYHLPFALRLRGPLDAAAMRAALDALVRRHDGLRCRFPAVDGEPYCDFADALTATFALRELDVSSAADPAAAVDALAAEEARAPFDLARGPLIRGALVRETDDSHVLMVTMHHIVSDGASLLLIADELASLYNFLVGSGAALAPLAPSMRAHARRQADEPPPSDAEVDFWRKTLKDVPELLPLPTDRVRPAHADHRGGFEGLVLDEAMSGRLKALAYECGTSLFNVMLSSWILLMSRLSGQSDVVIGVAMANRESDDRRGLIGNLVSTVPVRLEVAQFATPEELIGGCAGAVRAARHHKNVPLGAIVAAVGTLRQPGVHPLFQTAFSWPRPSGPTPAFSGLGASVIRVVGASFGLAECAWSRTQASELEFGIAVNGGSSIVGASQFDITPRAWEAEGRIAFGVEYASTLFNAETIARWLSHWRNLLEGISSHPGSPLSNVSILDRDAEREIIGLLNPGREEPADQRLLHERIAAWAHSTPDAVALRSIDTEVTFAQLEASSEDLAGRLVRAGHAGRRIAICLRRRPRMIVAALAVLKAGASYVPLDPHHPPARIALTVEDSLPALVLAEPETTAALASVTGVPSFDVDARDFRIEDGRAAESEPLPSVHPDDLAYVIYTSGTTGKPKGVQITHRALAAFVAVSDEYADSRPGDRVLQVSSIAFDVFLLDLSTSLARGATLYVPEPELLLVGETLADVIDGFAITHAYITPSALSTIPDTRTLPTLRFLQCGAELVPRALAERWRIGRTFLNLYGPTETTVCNTVQRVDHALEADPPIGRPFANSRVYVLDAGLRPVPEGVHGELFIGGSSLSKGYFGRDDLTTERFLPDPFSPVPGARMYRTGDIFHWRRDGILHFVGRNDSQVKIRGFRIELAEIESQLIELPGVTAAVVSVDRSAVASDRLVAHVVAPPECLPAAIRGMLRERLPDYMIPATFVRMDTIPITANGKADRRALPRPEWIEDEDYLPPTGELQTSAATVWKALLGVDRIGRGSDFFALGGHSLLAVQVVSRLRRTLGIDVAVGDLFSRPVLSDFADLLASRGVTSVPALVASDRDATLPLSFAQQRIWFLCQLDSSASRAYHMPFGLRLLGALDIAALRRAFDRLVERHESLRTTFALEAGTPVQVVAPANAAFVLAVEDLRAEADPAAAAREAAARESDAPFDLRDGPLLRGRLLHVADGEHHLLVTQHHILTDGWSQRVLIEELAALYAEFARGNSDASPAVSVQYADYAIWQRRHVEGALLQAQADYWRRQLAGAPTRLSLPLDRARPERSDHAGHLLRVELDAGTTAALRRFAQRHGATLFHATLASWAALLSRLSGQTDLVIGTPTANRGQRETEELIGFFVNALALRIDVGDDPTVAQLLARVKQTALGALANQDIPFEKVVELLQPERSLAHNPLFQVAFAWQGAEAVAPAMPGLTTALLPRPPHRSAIFDLSLHLWDAGATIVGVAEYATAVLDEATVARWLANWQVLLAAFVQADEAAVGSLPLLSPADRQFLSACQPPETPAAAGTLARIAAHVASAPQAPAIVHGVDTIDYGALDRRARALAARLRRAGVDSGARVALCLPRGADFIVAMLATAYAGAAYVPIDPQTPPERLRFLLVDAAPAALVADAAFVVPDDATLHDVPRVHPEAGAPEIDDVSPEPTEIAPGHVAYVIYTSGSTGRPKGVVVDHGNLANLVDWHIREFDLLPGDRCSSVAGLAFDAMAWEVWPALAAGATLVLPDDATARDPDGLLEWWCAQALDVSFLPTPLAELAFREQRLNRGLRTLLVGGDKLRVRPEGLPFRLVNAYGPTETTVVATAGDVRAGVGEPDVGRPIANTRVHVLDAHGQPVPIGVIGELHVAGAGVARGYLGRPELTAERFVADPFAGDGSRMYRTGDLGRWRADGTLGVVGRSDRQVKLRGFRVEPGEIEARMAEHPEIAEAAVALFGDADEPRLVGYVTLADPSDGEALASLRAAQVAGWRDLYDDNYAGAADADAIDDFTGWDSSFDGMPIPEEQMREWRDDTVARIRALGGRRILEIGCGSGLLLLQLAPDCERYVGTDLSGETIARLRGKCARLGLSQVTLSHRVATDFSGLDGGFDVVVINSVAQYFPDTGYLEAVIDGALRQLASDGALFLGDLRNHDLLATFHAAIHAARAAPDTDTGVVAAKAAAAAASDKELLVAPEYLQRLVDARADIGGLRLWPKVGRHHNELTAYRFDAILHRANLPTARSGVVALDWTVDGLDAASLSVRLAQSRDRAFVVIGITTPHLAVHRAIEAGLATGSSARTAALREQAEADASGRPTLAPSELVAAAAAAGRALVLHWGGDGDPGAYHALLLPVGPAPAVLPAFPVAALPEAPARAGRALANAPLRTAREALVVESLRDWLQRVLPAHMIPAQTLVLPRFPLTANGKLDRAALPRPGADRGGRSGHVPPRDGDERIVADAWRQALGLDRVDRDDDFFALGGHSLLAVRVVSRLRDALGADIALADLFARPRLADFVAGLVRRRDATPAIVPVPRGDVMPTSFAQQRLWFLAQLGAAASRAYHVPLGLRLDGPLDAMALRRALDALVERHESLRTTFVLRSGEPMQCIAAEGAIPLEELDLRDVPDAAHAARVLAEDEAVVAFDLARGPLCRARLLRVGDETHHLLLTQHHIVSDGWSLGVLLRELATLYSAFAAGEPTALPALPCQYADYAAWQRNVAGTMALRSQSEFWRRTLDGAPRRLELPVDRARPPEQDHAGGALTFELDAETVSSLLRLGQRHGTTLYQTLLASWALLMSRLSGQDDVVIGSPTANRDRRETEGLLGFFVNALPIRVDLSADPTVAELLARTKTAVLAALANQDVPFEQIVGIVQPERSLAQNPLFQTAFAWQADELPTDGFEGLACTVLPEPAVAGAKFDLAVALQPRGDGLAGSVVFAAALFDAATIARWLRHWHVLLHAMATHEHAAAASLPLLDDAQQQELNRFVRPRPDEAACLGRPGTSAGAAADTADRHADSLPSRFRAQAKVRPEAIAVAQGDRELSYAALDTASDSLASRLLRLGLQTGDRVAVCMRRSPDAVVAFLAALKAGGVYFPLDPAHPPDRLRALVEDASPRFVVVDDALAAPIAPISSDVRLIGFGDDEPGTPIVPLPDVPGNSIAYLIYTSGSSGKPKGVLVGHRAVLATTADNASALGIDASARIFNFASPGFDMSVFDLVHALCSGARLCLPSGERLLAGEGLAAELASGGATHACLTPSVLATLEDGPLLAGLRTITVAGEPAPAPLARYWARGRSLINAYGPTEAAIIATLHECDPSSEEDPPIGRPLAGVSCYVLDARGQAVPIGVIGELYLGGSGIAHGYLDRPELTAERFLRDPFSPTPGARMYRTGDRVRWRADGRLAYVGRDDDQVKLRGFRIELGEVEAAVASIGGIEEAAVLLREDVPGERRLVAYCRVAAADPDLPARMRATLLATLPDYMVPAACVQLPAFPLTANGKLARKLLPAPDADAYAQRVYEEPDGELETVIAAIWRELLGRERVGRHDDYFHLGGSSLGLLQVAARLAQHGLQATVTDLFRHSTVEALAAHFAQRPASTAGQAAECLRPGSGRPLFLVHDGSGMLLYAQRLAEALDAATGPVFGLPAPAPDESPPHSMTALARRLADMVRACQPAGPYRLAGWSFGGMLAYELAAQLVAEGEAIEWLALLDCHLPDPGAAPAALHEEKAHLLSLMQIEAFGLPHLQAALEELRAGADAMTLAELVAAADATRTALLPAHLAGLPEPELMRYLHRQQALHHAAIAWQPPRADLDVRLYVAEAVSPRADVRWCEAVDASRLHVETVPGDHHSMLRDAHLPGLARRLSAALCSVGAAD